MILRHRDCLVVAGIAVNGQGIDFMDVRLTEQQARILRLVARGCSNDEIASTLGVSNRTVRTHIERLFKRNGWHSRAQAVNGWLVDSVRDSDRAKSER